MANKHTLEELNHCSREELITIVLMMQGQLDALNENLEKLIEQVCIANNYRFGRQTETLQPIEGQLSFFDEAEASYDESSPEPAAEEVLPAKQSKKKKGQRNLDLKDFPEEIIPPYSVSEAQQDEFLRGDRPKDLLRNSIVTPSLLASILNVRYVNSSALHRIEQEFERNGVNISWQTMSNWIIKCSNKYFAPFIERMKQKLLSLHVTQSDETPTWVIGDSDHPNSKCYMWVHRSGEFYSKRPIVIYEYQKGRDHQKPLEFYKDYKGILVTDSLQQYHLVDKKLAEFYNADTELKELSSEERLQKRQEVIKPMVEEFFAWIKQQVTDCTVPTKSKTGQGLNFIINQEKYLKVFLKDGDVPIDNSASERVIRTFCLGKKNWMFHNTANGTSASAMVYSISETAKLNNLRPYYYFKYILTELPKLCDEKGNIDPVKLDYLMPWSESLPEECRKPRRS